MNALVLSLLIVTAPPSVSTNDRYPGVTQVFSCDFGESADSDYDGWPDHWTRRSGPAFPLFNKMALCDQSPPGGGRSLRLDLDGGGAVAFSPALPLSPLCDYLVEGYVKTEGVVHNRVFLSLEVLGPKRKVLQSFHGERLPGSPQWTKLRLGPVSPEATEAEAAVVGLHIEPSAKSDLKASAMFGGIWLGRLPRMTLASDLQTRIYTDPKRIAVTCSVSGLTHPGAKASLELTDPHGAVLNRDSRPLHSAEPSPASAAKSQAAGAKEPRLLAGKTEWVFSAPGPGMYRVRATVEGHLSDFLHREITLAVIRAQHTPERSEFGWSVARGTPSLSLEALGGLLAQGGVGWVKYPIWLEADEADEKIRPLAAFLEQMTASGINVVGTLDQPPAGILARFDSARLPSAAEVFGEKPEVWSPSLQRTMALVGTQVRWWQLGRDEDTSFCGYPDLAAKTLQVKRELDRAAYGLNMGLGWNWLHPAPSLAPGKTPWRFLSLTADPPLTADELATYLPTVRREQTARWVQLKLLGRRDYGLEDRAIDLVRRVLAAKLQGAEAIFVSDAFDNDHGLMDHDGRPNDLFLPWRTTALALGGAEPLEGMRLPEGSTAQVFVRDHDATMVAWNRRPTEETLFLGEKARRVDVWGHDQPLAKSDAGHQVRLGPVPVFVIGLNRAIALWRHGCVLGTDRIPSVFNQRQLNRIEFRNTFEQPVAGSVTLQTAEPWTVRPDRFTFRLKPAETFRQDLELTLPSNANSGLHVLHANFELTGDPSYRFSAYRTIQVGLGDVRIDLTAHLNHKGELEVQQWTVNEGDRPIDFRCQLFAPGRQRLATQIVGLRRGQDLKIFRFPEGRDLVGKTLWLQAQEANGPQVLNYRFVAEP